MATGQRDHIMAIDVWADDKLDRKLEAAHILTFLTNRIADRRARSKTGSYVLNLDSEWGHGKSFFLERLKLDIEAQGHAVACLNAWECDFSDDPLIALMASIEDSLKPFFKSKTMVKKAWEATVKSGGTLAISLVKSVAKKAAEKHIGEFVDEFQDRLNQTSSDPARSDAGTDADDRLGAGAGVADAVEKLSDSALEKLISAFRHQSASISTFKGQVESVVRAMNRSDPKTRLMFVLVDELDRCRPSFAIRLLESAKHLFSIDGMVFIVATDTSQLSESVKAVYGAGFDSRRYLNRFFDRTYRFIEPSILTYVEYLFSAYKIKTADLPSPGDKGAAFYSAKIFEQYKLSLRDIDQCFDSFATIVSLWSSKAPIQIGYMWPLIILFHFGKIEEFEAISYREKSRPQAVKSGKPVIVLETAIRNVSTRESHISRSYVDEYTDKFVNGLYTSLDEIKNDSTLAGQFVERQLSNEFYVLHNNRMMSNNPPYSIMRDYPEFVMMAERFRKD